ncbi:MAG: 50S ribosomal protein L5 [Candidatus Peregrinibacteria bacterium]|nr:50S ribosomal protein L5 [Candidatus Peregrinibacteria bacterium]
MTKSIDLKTRFNKEIAPELKKTLKLTNVMAVPKVTKITINVGLGTYLKTHNKDHASVVETIGKITGQRPVLTKARKAISNFKTREGEIVGIKVTLRGTRMYDFLNKLVNITFPRVRDFRGISPKAFDGQGNYSVGFKEHIVFPEISPDDVMKIHGVEVCISTTAKNNEQGFELLKAFGFPFKTSK